VYEQYWGLKAPPFQNVPDPNFFFLSARHREGLARLLYAVKHNKGAALLVGDVGCGKTTLSRALILQLAEEKYDVGLITNPALPGNDFLEEIDLQLGIHPSNNSKAAILRALNDRLLANVREGKETVLIVDEAHSIRDPDVFEELRMLLNFQLNDRFLLTLILMAQPEINEIIGRIKQLEQRIAMDRSAGYLPMLVVGTAGTVGVGAVDPLRDIAAVCRRQEVWFHVDGAYGAPAAALPRISDDLLALSEADSLALDPHKWLYSPLEAGCTLVKNPAHLEDAFSFHPEYYNFKVSEEEPALNYYELGMQNSRGFRALKVWLALRMVGKAGFVRMIRDDISLSRAMFDAVRRQPALEPFAQNLSIATFRYLPQDLRGKGEAAAEYVNDLNRELLNRLQTGGEAFISNAVVDGTYLLRACIVNFRTKLADVKSLPELVVRIGSQVDSELRPASLHA